MKANTNRWYEPWTKGPLQYFFLFPKVNGQRKTKPRHRYLKICKNDKLDVYTVNDEDEYERESWQIDKHTHTYSQENEFAFKEGKKSHMCPR